MPIARLIEKGRGVVVVVVHVINTPANGHTTYNLMCFNLSMLVLKYMHIFLYRKHTLAGGQFSLKGGCTCLPPAYGSEL